MELIQIKHYVENSFEGKPSFVLAMPDGKDYVSNGCVFVEATEENLANLRSEYDCAEYLEELFKSDSIALKDVTDARCMFDGCKSLTSFSAEMPSVTDARCMFDGCESLTSFSAEMPSVTYARCMFYGCKSLGEGVKAKII